MGTLEHLQPAIRDMPLLMLLAICAVLGIGLSTYSGALNDLFDLRKDRALAPQKPIASGRILPQTAALIGFVSILASILAASLLGMTSLIMCLACVSAILFYHVIARHLPAFSILTVAGIYILHMLMVNPGLRFIWPVILIMLHATIVAAVVRKLERRTPHLTVIRIILAVPGVAVLILILFAQTGHEGTLWTPAFSLLGLSYPFAAIIIFILTSINKIRFASSRNYAAEKLQRYGSLWIGIYGVMWLLGGGLFNEAIILGSLVIVGMLWMFFVRDLGAWIEQPIGYQW